MAYNLSSHISDDWRKFVDLSRATGVQARETARRRFTLSAQSHEATSPEPLAAPYAPLSIRAFLIGLILSPILIAWAEYTEIVAGGADLVAMSLIMAVVLMLLVVLLLNGILRRFAPKHALTVPEMMVIYTMNTTSIGICGIGMMQFLPNALAGVRYFATPENGWKSWMYLLRPWTLPSASVVADYYNGNTTFFTREHIIGWLIPIAVWSGFIFALMTAMYCMATLLRKQWVESERLMFPIVVVPLEIAQDETRKSLLSNGVFWGGFLVAFGLEILAALHYSISPTIPYVPIKPSEALFNVGNMISTPPWTGFGYFVLAFYPLVIGISYLLSLDVSFSCWFFYLLMKMENVGAVSMGIRDAHDASMLGTPPYAGAQGVGAFVAIALMALAGAWPHLWSAFKSAFGNGSIKLASERDEPLSYRAAYLGLFVSTAVLIAFCIAIGIAWYVALAFIAIYFLFIITLTRVRAEAGLPWSAGPAPMAHGAVVNFLGSHAFSTSSLTGLADLRWFDADWRNVAMPSQLEAMKIAQSVRLNPRHLTIAVATATVVATLTSWVAVLTIYYHFGAASGHMLGWRTDQGHYGYDELHTWLTAPKGVDISSCSAALGGALITLAFGTLRRSFVWWPFNPLGYAVANTGALDWMWSSILVGWLFKFLTLKYGGMPLYRKTLPFFIGLIIGDYAAGGLWSLVSLCTGVVGYRTFPV
jgi:hypothetical protein